MASLTNSWRTVRFLPRAILERWALGYWRTVLSPLRAIPARWVPVLSPRPLCLDYNPSLVCCKIDDTGRQILETGAR